MTLFNICVQVWSLLMETPSNISNLSPRQVMVWATCAALSIHLQNTCKSFLTSNLARPLYIEKIQTVNDAILFKLPFVLASPALPKNTILSIEETSKVRSRLTRCIDEVHVCVLKVPSSHCLAALTRSVKALEFFLPNRSYHPLDRTVAEFYTSFHTTKNFFLARKMATFLHRSAQAGLVDFWYMKVMRNYRLCDLSRERLRLKERNPGPIVGKASTDAVGPLTMGHLDRSFQLLVLCWCVAGVVFLLEILSSTKMHCRIVLFLRSRWGRLRKGRSAMQ